MKKFIKEVYINNLSKQAKELGVYDVCEGILLDKRFPVWSGSSQPNQHHYGDGGLIRHTSEVVNLCFEVKSYYSYRQDIDPKELFLSAFFHDVGKMYDYEREIHGVKKKVTPWKSATHKRYIHHISRSGIIWAENARKNQDIYDKYFEKVLHAILSHHTRREAGSPVAPKSRVAWMVTLCDNLSARIDDADTLDILDGRKR